MSLDTLNATDFADPGLHAAGLYIGGEWLPGDVLLIRWQSGEPSHVGLVADYVWGGLSIIHASTLHGVIETALSGDIRERVIETYRPRYPTNE